MPVVTPLPPTAGEPLKSERPPVVRAREAEFRADVLREGAGRGDDSRFDFHLLRLAIELVDAGCR